MYMDRVTEAIAHFIGVFEVAVEDERLRKDYDAFRAQKAAEEKNPEIAQSDPDVPVARDPGAYQAGVFYEGRGWTVEKAEVDTFVSVDVAAFTEFFEPFRDYIPEPHGFVAGYAVMPGWLFSMMIEPAGQIAVYIIQQNILWDNDILNVGGSGVLFAGVDLGGPTLESLIEQASISPIGRPLTENDYASVADFTEQTLAAFDAFVAANSGTDGIFIARGESLQGIFVNGEMVDEAPDLMDLLPRPPEDEATSSEERVETEGGETSDGPKSAEGHLVEGPGFSLKASVEIEMGANQLTNSVSLTNDWLESPITVVMGDCIEINAIVQVNAYCDIDLVAGSLGELVVAGSAATKAFNIAQFVRTDPRTPPEDDANGTNGTEDSGSGDGAGQDMPVDPVFPSNWVVTTITGDFACMNWIQQYNFMSDTDIATMASTGVTTTVTMGENIQFSSVSLYELGFYYDLIVCGGTLYDLNLISQMNVMLDNDLVGGVNGFSTTGQGSVTSGNNLLWNQASVTNIGAADRFAPMSDNLKTMGENFADGNRTLTDAMLNDPAFAGMDSLRVLYITGDIIDIQYISQINILGDNDQLALAMSALGAHPEAEWSISTGENALVNLASIVDVDSLGNTYVAGDQYSDDLLIQAEFISSDPLLAGQDPNALVNEAVAFLTDDSGLDDGDCDEGIGPGDMSHSANCDVMQTMLA